MSHTCHAVGCNRPVPPSMLMCRTDWALVPEPLKRRVWQTYRPGQCDDWQPSQAYCEAAKAAVLAVARAHGITVAPNEPKVALYDWIAPKGDLNV